MKKLISIALTVALFGVVLVNAQADSHMDSKDDQAQWDRHVNEWQKRMNKMYRQMEEIDRTTDPERRQQLLDEHWKLMEEQMFSMRMMGGGMMSHRHGRGRHGQGPHMMMDPDQRDQYMYDRMDMMQLMMEQMMQHQHVMMRGGMYRR